VLEGPIRQIGYIVRDLDAAMQSWLAQGVGPWFTMANVEQKDCLYRGEPCDATASLAFANSGPMQIELIQLVSDGPNIYREFLDTHGEGFHQFAWWAQDFDGVVDRAKAAGWPVVWSGGEGGGVRYAYFELDPRISTVVELMELTEASQGLADLVTAAAEQWDGVSDPVRSLL
jgi:hypothetical protein